MSVPNKILSNDIPIPYIGLGTFLSQNPVELENAVKAAVEAGYRHFDCAYFYRNEDVLGRTLRNLIEESNGQLKREDFYITTKCWNTFHSKEKAKETFEKSLSNFGFDYIDLVF
jgi:aldehyde reductase